MLVKNLKNHRKNQKALYVELELAFSQLNNQVDKGTWDYGHGRYEERSCQILEASNSILNEILQEWMQLNTIIRITSKRSINEHKEESVRYYISSLTGKDASYFNQSIRDHWSIENQLHWHLDVTFNEDQSRVRTGFAPQNLNLIRKIALQLLTNKDDKLSLKKRRFKASLDINYLISFF